MDAVQAVPVNSQCKDSLFKRVYGSERRQKELASFLLGIDVSDIHLANIRPVLFGSKENDLEQETIPARFALYDNDMRRYALAANGITYMQRAVKGQEKKYIMPDNILSVVDYLKLLMERGIFVDLFSDKEVCDMTMAQFSRDDMLIYQGREEGKEEGREEGREEERLDSIRNLAELAWRLGQTYEKTRDVIVEKYPGISLSYIESILKEIY